jgi:predicted PurR-regulated permease PerM
MQQPHKKNTITLVAYFLVLTVLLSVTIKMILPFLLSIFMGAILAVLSSPLFHRLRSRHVGARSSALLTLAVVLFLIIGPAGWFITVSIRQGIHFGQELSHQTSIDSVIHQVSSWPFLKKWIGSSAQLEHQIRNQLKTIGVLGSQSLLGLLGSLPSAILQIVLALISCYFFIIDGKKFILWLNEILPLDSDVRDNFYKSFRDTAISTIWATIAAASVQASIMFLSYLVLGVPGPFLAAGATFIFAWIPLIGSTPVWLLAAVYLYNQGSIPKMILMLAAGGFTGVIDNFIRPLVLKGRSDIHPLVGLIAIFGGIKMFGLFGVFIGPILTAVLLSLINTLPLMVIRSQSAPQKQEILIRESPAGLVRPGTVTEKKKKNQIS